MKREFLKGLGLEQEQIDKIMSEHGKSIEGFKAQVNELEKTKEELQATKDQMDKLENDLKGFESQGKELEDYKKLAEESKAALETFKEEAGKRDRLRNVQDKFKSALSSKFSPDAIDLIVKTSDLESFQLTEAGEIVDIESKLNKIAEERPTLVIKQSDKSDPPPQGGGQDTGDAALRKAMGLS